MWSLASRRGPLPRSGTPLAANDTFTGSPKTLTYTPDGNYNGSDGFKFTVTDSGDPAGCGAPGARKGTRLNSTHQMISNAVISLKEKPTAAASPASLSLNEDGSTTVDVSGSDVETAAAGLFFKRTAAHPHLPSFPTRRSSDLNDTFTGSPKTLTYTPDGNYNGSDGFKFTVTDSGDPAGCGAP